MTPDQLAWTLDGIERTVSRMGSLVGITRSGLEIAVARGDTHDALQKCHRCKTVNGRSVLCGMPLVIRRGIPPEHVIVRTRRPIRAKPKPARLTPPPA